MYGPYIHGCIFDTRGAYIQTVCMGSAYRSLVYTAHTGELFDTRMIRAVHTGVKKCTRIYGPYLRVVRIGL